MALGDIFLDSILSFRDTEEDEDCLEVSENEMVVLERDGDSMPVLPGAL